MTCGLPLSGKHLHTYAQVQCVDYASQIDGNLAAVGDSIVQYFPLEFTQNSEFIEESQITAINFDTNDEMVTGFESVVETPAHAAPLLVKIEWDNSGNEKGMCTIVCTIVAHATHTRNHATQGSHAISTSADVRVSVIAHVHKSTSTTTE